MQPDNTTTQCMARFRYSFHADLAAPANLGLLVWNEDEIRYFPCRGNESRSEQMNDGIRRSLSTGTTVQEIAEYYLERGGGGYESFSDPEEIRAHSVNDAARTVAVSAQSELLVPERRRPSCSSCGGADDLHLVTALIFGPSAPGRLFVYCGRCRDQKAAELDVVVPLRDVAVPFFVSLYRDGKTGSDPAMAAEIVFGEAPIDAVRGALLAMARS